MIRGENCLLHIGKYGFISPKVLHLLYLLITSKYFSRLIQKNFNKVKWFFEDSVRMSF